MKIEEAAGITWKRCEPPVNDEIVDELERILRVRFPADFRHVMQRCHGGVPTNGVISTSSTPRSGAQYDAKIPGYTWHHHQEQGRMQLVPESLHADSGHVGGFDIWYGD